MIDYNEILEGMALIWSNQFDEAEKVFEKKKGWMSKYTLAKKKNDDGKFLF